MDYYINYNRINPYPKEGLRIEHQVQGYKKVTATFASNRYQTESKTMKDNNRYFLILPTTKRSASTLAANVIIINMLIL